MRHLKLAITILGATAAWSQPAMDPPSRVARLNFVKGPVSFRPGTVEEWAAANVNYPLTTGDHLWADQGATVEMHVGSTAIRMDQGTALAVTNLNDQLVQLSVTAGSVDIHLRYLGQNENFEVDTPNAAIMLLRTGDYRINADGDNAITVLAVHAGDAEVTAGGQGFNVRASQSARLVGMDTPSQELAGLPPLDGFDDWCRNRDIREDRPVQSARYVPREMIGYEDLDSNGVWTESAQYGWVWRPTVVAAGWAPYRQGHWAWVSPWGWTWIDDAAWGFAPFHYGRWASYGGAWVWIPGAITARPVYSPALVAFVGGGGFSISVRAGGGGVAAWFPLGPGEVYRPAYHVSDVYVRNMNVAYVRDVTVINRVNVVNVTYVNQRVVGAVTVVPHETFVGARPVASAVVVVPQREIFEARVVGHAAAIAPERTSIVASATVVVRQPPARFEERSVVVRNAPPPPPVSFAAQRDVLRTNQGRPLDATEMNSVRPQGQAPRQTYRQINQGGGFSRQQGGGGQTPVTQTPQQQQPRVFGNQNPPAANPSTVTPPVTQTPQQQQPRVFGNQNPPAANPSTVTPPVTQTPPQQPRPQDQPRVIRNDRPAAANPSTATPQVTPQPRPAISTPPAQSTPPVTRSNEELRRPAPESKPAGEARPANETRPEPKGEKAPAGRKGGDRTVKKDEKKEEKKGG